MSLRSIFESILVEVLASRMTNMEYDDLLGVIQNGVNNSMRKMDKLSKLLGFKFIFPSESIPPWHFG